MNKAKFTIKDSNEAYEKLSCNTDGFSYIALSKLNKMICRDDFVAISSVSDECVIIQYKSSMQKINKHGRVENF